MPKINTYTDNATIEDVDALLTYDPAGNGATKLTTFARIASWISSKLSALTKKTSIASTDQLVMVDGAASPVVTKRIDYNVLAKAIIEQYASSSLAGANQSVKTAIDALNSNAFLSNGSITKSANEIFGCGSFRNASGSITNTPNNDTNGTLLCFKTTGNSCVQIYFNASLSTIHVRGNWAASSVSWTAWTRLAFS